MSNNTKSKILGLTLLLKKKIIKLVHGVGVEVEKIVIISREIMVHYHVIATAYRFD